MQSSFSLDDVRRFLSEKLRRNSVADAAAKRADENDVSYEDALLDLQLRNYFRAEFGVAQPPSGLFPRLLAAIRAHERREAAIEPPRPRAALLSLYRLLGAPAAGRLVSGGIAAAIMIAVLSSNSAHFLRGTAVSLVREESTPTAQVALSEAEAAELATNRDNRFVTRRVSVGTEAAFYDPAELRVPARLDVSSRRATPILWKRFGGQ
jgi:hypothetical protein